MEHRTHRGSCSSQRAQSIFYVLNLFVLEKGGRGTSMCGCPWYAPYWGPGRQPRPVPSLGAEPEILWFAGLHSIH